MDRIIDMAMTEAHLARIEQRLGKDSWMAQQARNQLSAQRRAAPQDRQHVGGAMNRANPRAVATMPTKGLLQG